MARSSPHFSCKQHACRGCQRGSALLTVLMLVLIVTIIGVSMMRKIAAEERMAGSTREHQRAFEAAQNALQFAESWLDNSYLGNINTCASGTTQVSSATDVQVCDATLSVPGDPGNWATQFTLTPAGMSLSTTGGDGTTFAVPGFYITSLGLAPDGRTQLYQVTSYGYGGSADAVSVIQSTYALSAKVTNLDTP